MFRSFFRPNIIGRWSVVAEGEKIKNCSQKMKSCHSLNWCDYSHDHFVRSNQDNIRPYQKIMERLSVDDIAIIATMDH